MGAAPAAVHAEQIAEVPSSGGTDAEELHCTSDMTTAALSVRILPARIRCHYRPILLAIAAVALLATFWFTSRYPSLLGKAAHVSGGVASMAWASEVLHVAADAPAWERIGAGAINWLASMRVGMTFGVLLGALLHTMLRYYPLRIGKNLYLNSLKGGLVGMPAGVCVNCSVPVACGVTRGRGQLEVALGFLFSSPNFNPVVVAMTFTAMPLAMSTTKYVVLFGVIALGVPVAVRLLTRGAPRDVIDLGAACAIDARPRDDCDEPLSKVLRELGTEYAKNAWTLTKPTITLMVVAALAASATLTYLPLDALLAHPTPLRMAIASVVSVFLPVPIALDVMFAAQLQAHAIAPGYVMLFLMTLGTFSIIPTIYLWREVSKRLAVGLFLFFVVLGFVSGLVF